MASWPTREDWARHLDWVKAPAQSGSEVDLSVESAVIRSLEREELRVLLDDFREQHREWWESLPSGERAARTETLIAQDRIDNPGAYRRRGKPGVPWG